MKNEAVFVPQRWEDIVFENRNRDYGAYLNRKSYPKHVIFAVLGMIFIIAFVLAWPTIAEWIKGQQVKEAAPTKTVNYNDLSLPPPIKDTPPPPKLELPPPVKTIIKFLPPKVTEKEVVEEEEMPTIEEIKQNDTGAENIEGTGEVVFDEPVQQVMTDEKEDEDKIFLVVEQSAAYPGGMEAMAKFIGKNLKYPPSAKRTGVSGRVFVGFVVERDGAITDVKVIKGISADCDKEAVRVISMMPAWAPGKQNGRAVRSRFVLPIVFTLN